MLKDLKDLNSQWCKIFSHRNQNNRIWNAENHILHNKNHGKHKFSWYPIAVDSS